MSFEKIFLQNQEYINTVIKNYIPVDTNMQQTVVDAMEYSLTVGGKRIRPILMLETYKVFGGEDNIIEPFFVAMEMIHTYSLVHDDLPAMDDDDYRRGMLTTHKKYGEAIGVLTGDALLNYAFEIMSEACLNNSNNMLAPVKAMALLSKKAGLYGMIGGQVVDIESENKKISMDEINFIHKCKTAALIEGAMCIGAILAGASDEEVENVENIATKIGLAFQIQDDVLDVISSTEQLGKPVGSDEKNNKATFVTLYGLEKSRNEVKRLSSESINQLKKLDNTDFIIDLAEYLINRKI